MRFDTDYTIEKTSTKDLPAKMTQPYRSMGETNDNRYCGVFDGQWQHVKVGRSTNRMTDARLIRPFLVGEFRGTRDSIGAGALMNPARYYKGNYPPPICLPARPERRIIRPRSGRVADRKVLSRKIPMPAEERFRRIQC